MTRSQGKLPSYRHQKSRGLAVVRLNGHDHYLGPYGTEASRREYDRLIAEWLANGRTLPRNGVEAPDLTIAELVAAYWRFVNGHYTRSGQPTREPINIRAALKPVVALYGATRAGEFGPTAYKAVRQSMIDSGLCRTTVQHRLGKVRRLFRWAIENELVPADLLHRLKAVAPLRPGRDGVRERDPVKPLADDEVDPILPFLTPPVRAMVQLQRLTGMRPGEVVAMTTGAIDRSGELWIYRPAHHKQSWRGRERRIILGPRAQEVVREWLKADPDASLFSPREWMERFRADQRAGRRTPASPAHRRRKEKPKRTPRERYDKNSYRHAIAKACQRAGIPPWGPNRLRHSAGTEIRRQFGLEAAQVILGHAKADVTQIYAEADTEAAMEVMRKIG